MNELQLAITSLIAGGILSAVVSWYFFRKSTDKKLSVYIQFASPVLGGIDDQSVRSALEIRYRGTRIEDLVQLQFVVANEGQRAIRDLIEPLHLLLPHSVKLLEAKVLHVQPRGREVDIAHKEVEGGKTRVDIRFKLLNKGELFFVKLLLNGELDPEPLRFRITVDDLPPTITPKQRPYRTPEEEPAAGLKAVVLGIAPLALAFGSAFGVYALIESRPNLFPGAQGFEWLTWQTLGILLWMCSIIYWLAKGVQLVVFRGVLGPRHHFHLPYAVLRADYPVGFRANRAELRRALEDPTLSPHERRRLLRRYAMVTRELDSPRSLENPFTDEEPPP